MVSEFGKTFSGHQPHQVVCFDNHLCPHYHRNGSLNVGFFHHLPAASSIKAHLKVNYLAMIILTEYYFFI